MWRSGGIAPPFNLGIKWTVTF